MEVVASARGTSLLGVQQCTQPKVVRHGDHLSSAWKCMLSYLYTKKAEVEELACQA